MRTQKIKLDENYALHERDGLLLLAYKGAVLPNQRGMNIDQYTDDPPEVTVTVIVKKAPKKPEPPK
jgi:hypothetical protein